MNDKTLYAKLIPTCIFENIILLQNGTESNTPGQFWKFK